jgi:hypothetical protein
MRPPGMTTRQWMLEVAVVAALLGAREGVPRVVEMWGAPTNIFTRRRVAIQSLVFGPRTPGSQSESVSRNGFPVSGGGIAPPRVHRTA